MPKENIIKKNRKLTVGVILLVVLVVLIVIAIVISFRIVNKSIEEVTEGMIVCQNIEMSVFHIVNSVIDIEDTITVQRGPEVSGVEGVTAMIYLNGDFIMNGSTELGPSQKEAIRIGAEGGIREGDIVEIAAKLPDGSICAASPKMTVGKYSVIETPPSDESLIKNE